MSAPRQFNAHRKGLLLTGFGGLMLSFDVPLVRLGAGDVWSVIALRSIATFVVAIIAWTAIRAFTRNRPPLMPGWEGAVAGMLYGLSTISFLASIYHTASANAVFIVAFNPMLCALLAWLFLKERPSLSTLMTMAVMAVGVAMIVGNGLSSGHLPGDLMAANAALMLAAAITVSRSAARPLGFAPLVATLFPALVAVAFALPRGFSIAHPGWILLDGAIMMPLAFWCLATGPRYLSGPEVGMFYLLETILAPIWLWMIFTEVPGAMTLAGGGVLIVALAGHSLWRIKSAPQRPAKPSTASP